MEKFAFMITAYTEPKTMCAVINALDDECFDFYVHIDKKVNIDRFKSLIENKKNVFFLPEDKRVKIYWGGKSQIEMQYNLVQMIFESGVKYARIINITGMDYPVFSNENIKRLLSEKDKEYITGYCLNTSMTPKQRNKILCYHIMQKGTFVRGIFEKLKIRRAKSFDALGGGDFYFGSEYWALSLDVLKELMQQYDSDVKLRKVLEYAFAPSEIWIHTLFFRSRFSHLGSIYNGEYKGLSKLSPITYFEYTNAIKVLTEDDFDAIVQANKPFARKVILGKSDRLIQKIEELKK